MNRWVSKKDKYIFEKKNSLSTANNLQSYKKYPFSKFEYLSDIMSRRPQSDLGRRVFLSDDTLERKHPLEFAHFLTTFWRLFRIFLLAAMMIIKMAGTVAHARLITSRQLLNPNPERDLACEFSNGRLSSAIGPSSCRNASPEIKKVASFVVAVFQTAITSADIIFGNRGNGSFRWKPRNWH